MGVKSADAVKDAVSSIEQALKNVEATVADLLTVRSRTVSLLQQRPYSLPLYLTLASAYVRLGYPDLAVGAAYKALLLSDSIQEEGDEYHEDALEDFEATLGRRSEDQHAKPSASDEMSSDPTGNRQLDLIDVYVPEIYEILIRSLASCGCLSDAHNYCSQARKRYPDSFELSELSKCVNLASTSESIEDNEKSTDSASLPTNGVVRREVYPWNAHEPDRLAEMEQINAMMRAVAPKLEVRIVHLPVLSEAAGTQHATQLGVFAKEDLHPGDMVLDESSLLTANNRLLDALCDACSADLPAFNSPGFSRIVPCLECEVVFCSQKCYDEAMENYHPALCGMDVEAIARDVPPAQAADSLYALLLLRVLAMAETQECHPLDLQEVKYIWGDFHKIDIAGDWRPANRSGNAHCSLPRTLFFSFEYNVRLPFHMLEKMDIDFFKNQQYDVWVFNTLYAKFRGTASARLSGAGGRAMRGPEVSAVHPMWCMANHSCDPNVSWEWGGHIQFKVRADRVAWQKDGQAENKSQPGVRKGEEVLNHYCDIELNVQDRREWAKGALGGICSCARCLWESSGISEGCRK